MSKNIPVNQAYQALLRDMDPRLSKAIKKKYSQDRIEFIEAARKATPARELKHWASPKCKKCYGTGSRGIQNNYVGPATKDNRPVSRTKIRCKCAEENYMKWLAQFRVSYNEMKKQAVKQNQENEGQSNDESDTSEAATKSSD